MLSEDYRKILEKNWAKLQENIEETAIRYGRKSNEINVMVVSKGRGVCLVKHILDLGSRIFGENRVQEATEKFSREETGGADIYMIGHLQTNKAKKIDALFKGVHSVDSLKLARMLSSHRADSDIEVLLQVNTSGEKSKSGFRDEVEMSEAAAEIAALPGLNLKGVMTMAPFVNDEKIIRHSFSRARFWLEGIERVVEGEPVLSMGMSPDYRWAIAEGSTMLRIGSAIFDDLV